MVDIDLCGLDTLIYTDSWRAVHKQLPLGEVFHLSGCYHLTSHVLGTVIRRMSVSCEGLCCGR